MFKKSWSAWLKLDPIRSFAELAWSAVVLVTGLSMASITAWASTTWDWYWQSFQWAGIAFAFLAAWLVFAVGIFLIGFSRGRVGVGPDAVLTHGPRQPTTAVASTGSALAASYTKREATAFIEALNELLPAYDNAAEVFAKFPQGSFESVRPTFSTISILLQGPERDAQIKKLVDGRLNSQEEYLLPLQESLAALRKLQESKPPKEISGFYESVPSTGDMQNTISIYRSSIQAARKSPAIYYDLLRPSQILLSRDMRSYSGQIQKRREDINKAISDFREFLR